MDWKKIKCVMIVDSAMSPGLIANTTAILGITLGKLMPELVGNAVRDQSNNEHEGIIALPVPILREGPERLRDIRAALLQPEFQDITSVDFTDVAQGCRSYDEFIEKMGRCPESSLQYLALALCGPRKKVNRLTGSLPLLR